MKEINIKTFFSSFLAGITISFGGFIFLLSEIKIIGALFFTLGLFLVLTRQYDLYTGKIAYIPDNKISYILKLILIWFGNLCGSLTVSVMLHFTRFQNISENALTVTQTKLSQSPLSAFILAVFCGFIIYWAVENYKTNQHEVGKYFGLILLIPFFVICGFEHCVADMFYFAFALKFFESKSMLYLLIITIGNSIGSIILRVVKKYILK